MSLAKGNAAQVPEINRLAVLRSISERDTFSKMDVVREAHLSLPTVNDILLSLQNEGYVLPVGNGHSRGGRPPALFRFNPRVRYAVGVEIRIPTMTIGLLDLHGSLVDTAEYPFEDDATAGYVANCLCEGIDRLLSKRALDASRLVGIGVGVPGFVERDTGVWLGFPRVPQIRDLPLRPLLLQRYSVPVFIQNEMNVLALAQLQHLTAGTVGDLLMITCAEGIKASVVVDGHVLSGDNGNFGSVGHFIVVEGGRPCFCGARGCLETYASGHALRQALRAKGSAHPALPDLDDPGLPGRVFALAAQGDPTCRALVEEALPHMAYAFASFIRLTDIERVLLLGAYVEGGDYLQSRLYDMVAQRLPEVSRLRLSIRLGNRLATEEVLAAAARPAVRAFLGAEECAQGQSPAASSAAGQPVAGTAGRLHT